MQSIWQAKQVLNHWPTSPGPKGGIKTYFENVKSVKTTVREQTYTQIHVSKCSYSTVYNAKPEQSTSNCGTFIQCSIINMKMIKLLKGNKDKWHLKPKPLVWCLCWDAPVSNKSINFRKPMLTTGTQEYKEMLVVANFWAVSWYMRIHYLSVYLSIGISFLHIKFIV